MMNLRLAEYVVTFYSPCDHRYYVCNIPRSSELSFIYKSTLNESGIYELIGNVPWLLGFADKNTLNPRACCPRALGVYISKIPRSHGIIIT